VHHTRETDCLKSSNFVVMLYPWSISYRELARLKVKRQGHEVNIRINTPSEITNEQSNRTTIDFQTVISLISPKTVRFSGPEIRIFHYRQSLSLPRFHPSRLSLSSPSLLYSLFLPPPSLPPPPFPPMPFPNP